MTMFDPRGVNVHATPQPPQQPPQQPQQTRYDELRDKVNDIRRAKAGTAPEGVATGPLTEKGQKAWDLWNIDAETNDKKEFMSVSQYVQSVRDNPDLLNDEYLTGEAEAKAKAGTPREEVVFREFTSSEARTLVMELVSNLATNYTLTDEEALGAHDMVLEYLYSDITIDPETGRIESLVSQFGEAFPNLPGPVGLLLQEASQEIRVDWMNPLAGNRLGVAIRAAGNTVIDPKTGATMLSSNQVDVALGLVDKLLDGDLLEIGNLDAFTQDVVAWLTTAQLLVENLSGAYLANGTDLYSGFFKAMTSNVKLDTLDEERAWYAPGFDPQVERQKRAEESLLDAFGSEDKKFTDRVLDLIAQQGGARDPNLILDKDQKRATSRANKTVQEQAEVIRAAAELRGATPLEAFNEVAAFVESVFAPTADGGPNQYESFISGTVDELEAADLSNETNHKKAVRNAYFNTTGLSTDDLHTDVLSGLYSTLAGSTREEMRAFIEENQDDIRLQSKLAGMQSSEDLISLLKGIEGMPTLDQLDSPEAKTAFKKWIANSVDAIQAAEPAPSFGARLTRGAFPSGPPDPVGPADILRAKTAALQDALDQLNPVLTQAGKVVAKKEFDKQEKARLEEEATYWTSKRGEEGFREVMFQQGFDENSITPERRLELERDFSGPLGTGAYGSPAETEKVIQGFRDEKTTEGTFIAAGFAPDVARAAATDRIAEGFDINPLGEIVPKPLYRTERPVIPGIDPSYAEFGGIPGVDPSAPTYTEFEPVPTLTNEERLDATRIQLDPLGFPQRPTVDAKGNPIPTEAAPFDPVAETARGKLSMAAEQAAEAARVASQELIDKDTATAEWEASKVKAEKKLGFSPVPTKENPDPLAQYVPSEATFLAKHKAGRVQRAAEQSRAANLPIAKPFKTQAQLDAEERRRREKLRSGGRTVVRT